MKISMRSISLLLAGALASSIQLMAGEPVLVTAKKGKGIVSIYGGSARATRFYNTSGELQRYDTLQTDFVATTFGLGGNYGLTDELQLDVDVPLVYYSLTSSDRFPDRSIFAPAYVGVGATYQLITSPLGASVSVMGKIPPGFHRGIYDDPKHPSFLSDGFFQVTSSLNLGLVIDKSWVKGSVGYNWRDEEPLDEIIYALEVGLSKVEGTGVFLGCNGVVSTGDATKPARPFYAGAAGGGTDVVVDGGTGRFSTIDRENYFAVNAGAYVDLTDHLVINGKYIVRLFGTNSLALQGAYLGLGYKF
jgi:hypothetical protein